ncbi:hypothetical protein BCR42DRAFT_115476 [Absidia repens]|uniref:Uncharacterized protein n=1 Tax=Absidia repens TaxID=90262 RepID=A0A1X2I5P1_9FUNG|nr:hypothetical protein BCR42DRAFT_115476 [Absidia repens]
MERIFTNQDSFQRHTLTYSPPLQNTKDSNLPNLSPAIPSPSLTPPHSVTTPTSTTHTHPKDNTNYTKKNLADDTTLLNRTDTDNQPCAALETVASLDQALIRRLPPRKRMQSLKKQFTKPNLSVPVLSTAPCLTMNLVSSATSPLLQEHASSLPSTATITTTTETIPMQSTSKTDINTAYHIGINSSSSSRNYNNNNNDNKNSSSSRSPSPIIDIEDDSGDTTETDDEDDWKLHRKRSISESTLLSDDFGRPKHTVIIQQQQQHEPPFSTFSASSASPISSSNPKLPPKSTKSWQQKYQEPSSIRVIENTIIDIIET